MNRYFFPIFVRVIIILTTGFLAVYVLTSTYFWLVSIWIFAALIFLIWELSRYLAKTRRQFSEFLLAVSQDDFSTRRSEKRPDELQEAFEILRERYQQIRKEMAANSHFLQALVEHAGVALLGYQPESGKITIMNKAAKSMFATSGYHHIDAFSNAYPTLGKKIASLSSGMDALVKIQLQGQIHQLSLNAKELILADIPFKLISFQDIQNALENKELESWQKLIRVLTHEIKNSAIPISTLSQVINDQIIDDNGLRNLTLLDKEDKEDLKNGLETIGRRSRALVEFVNAYGKLARLPEPQPELIEVNSILSNTLRFLDESIQTNHILTELNCDDSITIWADRTLVEQVLINLVKNAVEALEDADEPKIILSCGTHDERAFIEISDNGPGMDDKLLDQIFVPFFSTKSAGSGIGLSLSRQIMRAHQGKLQVHSGPGKGSSFRLIF